MTQAANMIEKILTATKKTYSFQVQYSKDCENLSRAIFNKTNCSLSPTTLKRLFGFAKVKDKPSKFTLNTLAIYCGYTNWEQFVDESRKAGNKRKGKWEDLKRDGAKVSNYTLDSLKSNSGLPFQHTVKREQVHVFIEEFLNSDALATCIVGEGGSGKSIAIAHVVEDFWLKPMPKYPNDILWFLSGANLRALVAKQMDIESWFLDIFSLTKNVDYRNYFSENVNERKGRLVLIIDALDEAVLRSEIVDDLFRKIIEVVGSNVKTPWFKVVMTTRASTFERFTHIIKDYPGIVNLFYGLNFNNLIGSQSNLQILTEQEIVNIIDNINQGNYATQLIDFVTLNPSLRTQIAHPYYLQLFLQSHIQKTGDIHSNNDILNEFMAHRIYKGKYGFEKMEIFNTFLVLSDYGRKSNVIKKSDIEQLVNQYSKPYKELLSYGILKESQVANKYKVYQTFVKFGHDTLFEFLIAKHWVSESQNFSYALLEKISKTYEGNEKRIDIIKHIVLIGIDEGKFNELARVFELPLNDYELNRLSHIIGIQMRENTSAQEALIPLWSKNKAAQIYFFERFVDLDHLNGYYGNGILSYLKNKKNTEAQIFGHCLLFMKAYLSKDESSIKIIADKLSRIDFDMAIHPFPLGRQMACRIIAEKELRKSALSMKTTRQIFEIAKEVSHKQDFITGFPAGYHFHVMEALFLTGESELSIRLFVQMKTDFPDIVKYKGSWLYAMMLVYYAVALHKLGKKSEAKAHFGSVSFNEAFKDAPWYKNYFYLQYLKAQMNFISKKDHQILQSSVIVLTTLHFQNLGFNYYK